MLKQLRRINDTDAIRFTNLLLNLFHKRCVTHTRQNKMIDYYYYYFYIVNTLNKRKCEFLAAAIHFFTFRQARKLSIVV